MHLLCDTTFVTVTKGVGNIICFSGSKFTVSAHEILTRANIANDRALGNQRSVKLPPIFFRVLYKAFLQVLRRDLR